MDEFQSKEELNVEKMLGKADESGSYPQGLLPFPIRFTENIAVEVGLRINQGYIPVILVA
jgi:hypothetical protein